MNTLKGKEISMLWIKPATMIFDSDLFELRHVQLHHATQGKLYPMSYNIFKKRGFMCFKRKLYRFPQISAHALHQEQSEQSNLGSRTELCRTPDNEEYYKDDNFFPMVQVIYFQQAFESLRGAGSCNCSSLGLWCRSFTEPIPVYLRERRVRIFASEEFN